MGYREVGTEVAGAVFYANSAIRKAHLGGKVRGFLGQP